MFNYGLDSLVLSYYDYLHNRSKYIIIIRCIRKTWVSDPLGEGKFVVRKKFFHLRGNATEASLVVAFCTYTYTKISNNVQSFLEIYTFWCKKVARFCGYLKEILVKQLLLSYTRLPKNQHSSHQVLLNDIPGQDLAFSVLHNLLMPEWPVCKGILSRLS